MSLTFSGTNGTHTVSVNKIITPASEVIAAGSQIIGTTTEAITFGDVTSPGYFAVVNTDATNFVMIGLATPVTAGDAFVKLLPGEGYVVPGRQTVIYALADTAPVTIEKLILSL